MARSRIVNTSLPSQTGRHSGLAYGLWLPTVPPQGGVVIIHGADSCKENHHDFARVAIAAGFAAATFDQRGHGESDGPMDSRMLDDVVDVAALLRSAAGDPGLPIALRGSSMGGYLAIVAAERARARAVVAICPAPPEGLVRSLRAGRFGFDADVDAFEAFLTSHDLFAAVKSLKVPLLLLHAEGDERVPVEHSRELAAATSFPGSRLLALRGGHHRSIQHDGELQAASISFIRRALPRTVDHWPIAGSGR